MIHKDIPCVERGLELGEGRRREKHFPRLLCAHVEQQGLIWALSAGQSPHLRAAAERESLVKRPTACVEDCDFFRVDEHEVHELEFPVQEVTRIHFGTDIGPVGVSKREQGLHHHGESNVFYTLHLMLRE